MKNNFLCLVFFLISFIVKAQYYEGISEKDLKRAFVKALSIEEIQEDTITIRKNFSSVTSGLVIGFSEESDPPLVVRHLSEKEIYKKLIKDYIEIGNVEISSNIIVINYIRRFKTMMVNIVLKKGVNRDWHIINKQVVQEGNLRFNDFLYERIIQTISEQ